MRAEGTVRRRRVRGASTPERRVDLAPDGAPKDAARAEVRSTFVTQR